MKTLWFWFWYNMFRSNLIGLELINIFLLQLNEFVMLVKIKLFDVIYIVYIFIHNNFAEPPLFQDAAVE